VIAGATVPPGAFFGTTLVRAVPDPEPDGGPLVGVLTGLETVRESIALVVAGDMPGLEPEVLALLIRTLHSAAPDEVDAVVLAHRDRIQPVPIAVRTGSGTSAAQRGRGRGSRSLYAWLDGMRIHAIPEVEWRALDPDARTVFDIDREDDLRRL
jgi:molybdopterin-guanine dinucleotide biosynthesis protein A